MALSIVEILAAAIAANKPHPTGQDFLKELLPYVPEGITQDRILRAMQISPDELDEAIQQLGTGSEVTAQDAEVVQGTGDLHHQVRKSLLGIAKHIFHNPTPLDTRNHMLHHNPRPGNQTVGEPVGGAQETAPPLFLGLDRHHVCRFRALKAHILRQPGAVGIVNGFLVRDRLVVGLPGAGLAQIHHLPGAFVRQDHVLIGVGLFLPAVMFPLFFRVFRAVSTPLRAVQLHDQRWAGRHRALLERHWVALGGVA